VNLATVVLAAGAGTRMKSDLPKVMHPLAGRPMLSWVLEACGRLQPERRLVVIGHRYETVLPVLGADVGPVHQHEQLGTGHALSMAEPQLADFEGAVLVMSGDSPLIQHQTLQALVDRFEAERPAVVLMTAVLDDPTGYGRVIRDDAGAVVGIIEEKDATPGQRTMKEVNTGIYCFDRRRLFGALALIKNDNVQAEYYLTDVVDVMKGQGEAVLAQTAADPIELQGVNSRAELARAETVIQRRLKDVLMNAGATFILPETSYVTPEVEIERDAVILPNCYLEGKTRIGRGARIGPGARIIDSDVGEEAQIQLSVLTGCRVDERVNVGPFSYIRPGTRLREGSKAGAFVEIKKSDVGAGSKVPHLSYMGDATLGEGVNVGAGTITCNYDGLRKHKTIIEDEAFIGSDTMLIAPVTIGRGAVTGAGSSISGEVPADSLAIERADKKIFPGWAKKRRARKK
jgi:bifunctional UDP-N-acetylglucosamine pyrophosphorylase / glucosamine-1-phosphate N-acetyltransferase